MKLTIDASSPHGTADLVNLRWSPEFSELVVVSADAMLYVVSVSTRVDAAQPDAVQVSLIADAWASCHLGPVTGVAALPGGHHMVSTGMDGSVRIWDIGTRRRTPVLQHLLGSAQTALATNKSSGLLAVGSEYGVVRLFRVDMEGGHEGAPRLELLLRLRAHDGAVRRLEFSPSGAQLLSMDSLGFLCIVATAPTPRLQGFIDMVDTACRGRRNSARLSTRAGAGAPLDRGSSVAASLPGKKHTHRRARSHLPGHLGTGALELGFDVAVADSTLHSVGGLRAAISAPQGALSLAGDVATPGRLMRLNTVTGALSAGDTSQQGAADSGVQMEMASMLWTGDGIVGDTEVIITAITRGEPEVFLGASPHATPPRHRCRRRPVLPPGSRAAEANARRPAAVQCNRRTRRTSRGRTW